MVNTKTKNHRLTLIDIITQNDLVKSFIALTIFLLLLLSACASNRPPNAVLLQQYTAEHLAPNKANKYNNELAQKTHSFRKSYSVSDYRVGPEDLLDINVFQANKLKEVVRVSASGYIKFPLVGKIMASGLTVSELETLLAERLNQYINEPVVSVFVREYRSQQITVLGAVNKPNVYYVSGQRYLLDMLSLAGGLSNDAGTICVIQRERSGENNNSDNNEYIEKIIINLDELLINGRAELNIPVSSGDIIHVPESGIFFVDGAVKGPGMYRLKRKTTVTQAIGMAKGLQYEAKRSDIMIYRENEKAERDVILVDYDSILAGEGKDIEVKDNDIIIVSTDSIKNFFKGISTGIGFGSFSLGKGF